MQSWKELDLSVVSFSNMNSYVPQHRQKHSLNQVSHCDKKIGIYQMLCLDRWSFSSVQWSIMHRRLSKKCQCIQYLVTRSYFRICYSSAMHLWQKFDCWCSQANNNFIKFSKNKILFLFKTVLLHRHVSDFVFLLSFHEPHLYETSAFEIKLWLGEYKLDFLVITFWKFATKLDIFV